MELRDLMNEYEVLIEKARNDFTADAHGACREHLVDIREILNVQLPLGEPARCETTEPPSNKKELDK